MTIKLQCDCGKNLSVPDAHAGKTGKCPQCGTSITIPELPEEPEEEEVPLISMDQETAAPLNHFDDEDEALPPPTDDWDEGEGEEDDEDELDEDEKPATAAKRRYEAELAAAEAAVSTPIGALFKAARYCLTPGGIVFLCVAIFVGFGAQFVGILGVPIKVAVIWGGWMLVLCSAQQGPNHTLEFPSDLLGQMLAPGIRFALVCVIATLPCIGALAMGGMSVLDLLNDSEEQTEMDASYDIPLDEDGEFNPEAFVEQAEQNQSKRGYAAALPQDTDDDSNDSRADALLAMGIWGVIGLVGMLVGLIYLPMALAQVATFETIHGAN
ncbi:MAG: hypothetical protein ACYTGH_18745, partial [Planctomycetota bacterium]